MRARAYRSDPRSHAPLRESLKSVVSALGYKTDFEPVPCPCKHDYSEIKHKVSYVREIASHLTSEVRSVWSELKGASYVEMLERALGSDKGRSIARRNRYLASSLEDLFELVEENRSACGSKPSELNVTTNPSMRNLSVDKVNTLFKFFLAAGTVAFERSAKGNDDVVNLLLKFRPNTYIIPTSSEVLFVDISLPRRSKRPTSVNVNVYANPSLHPPEALMLNGLLLPAALVVGKRHLWRNDMWTVLNNFALELNSLLEMPSRVLAQKVIKEVNKMGRYTSIVNKARRVLAERGDAYSEMGMLLKAIAQEALKAFELLSRNGVEPHVFPLVALLPPKGEV